MAEHLIVKIIIRFPQHLENKFLWNNRKLETTDFNLKTIVELSINGINIFDENDIEKITDLTRIINVKINVLSKLNDINYEKKIQDILKNMMMIC